MGLTLGQALPFSMLLLCKLKLRLALDVSNSASIAFCSIVMIVIRNRYLIFDSSAKATLIVVISNRALSLS